MLSRSHDLPPALASVAGLGSNPFCLYDIIALEKLHVINLGVIRQFCDLAQVVLRLDSSLPLSKVMGAMNDRYSSLPRLDRLLSHRPFKSTADEAQAGI